MSESRWLYGDSWEKYPIEPGEVWAHKASGSRVMVGDLRDGLPRFMTSVDMVYCDPPWSKGNANAFITKAGLNTYVKSFDQFMDILFERLRQMNPSVCYLEVGAQHVQDFVQRLKYLYPCTQRWTITYYGRHRCYLLRGGWQYCLKDFGGMDDEQTPYAAVCAEQPASVADLCTGRGLTMLAAHRAGARFCGMELNKRRLAVALERAAKIGVRYEKDNSDAAS